MALTKEKMIEKYGDVELTFTFYDKGIILFQGIANDSSEIYLSLNSRYVDYFAADETVTLNKDYYFDGFYEAVFSIWVQKDGKQIFGWYQ